jgi:hypothetical protein
MFRSVIGDNRGVTSAYMAQDQVLMLRSALAAANAEDLRDQKPLASGVSQEEQTARAIPLKASIDGTNKDVIANIYGYEPQPFITEVYANTDDVTTYSTPTGIGTNPKGYVAIELYNPYPFDIKMDGWFMVVLERTDPAAVSPPAPAAGNPYPNGPNGFQLSYIATTRGANAPWLMPPGTTIRAHQYLFSTMRTRRDGYGAPSSAIGRPNEANIPGGVTPVPVPNLHWVIEDVSTDNAPEARGGELINHATGRNVQTRLIHSRTPRPSMRLILPGSTAPRELAS